LMQEGVLIRVGE